MVKGKIDFIKLQEDGTPTAFVSNDKIRWLHKNSLLTINKQHFKDKKRKTYCMCGRYHMCDIRFEAIGDKFVANTVLMSCKDIKMDFYSVFKKVYKEEKKNV